MSEQREKEENGNINFKSWHFSWNLGTFPPIYASWTCLPFSLIGLNHSANTLQHLRWNRIITFVARISTTHSFHNIWGSKSSFKFKNILDGKDWNGWILFYLLFTCSAMFIWENQRERSRWKYGFQPLTGMNGYPVLDRCYNFIIKLELLCRVLHAPDVILNFELKYIHIRPSIRKSELSVGFQYMLTLGNWW